MYGPPFSSVTLRALRENSDLPSRMLRPRIKPGFLFSHGPNVVLLSWKKRTSPPWLSVGRFALVFTHGKDLSKVKKKIFPPPSRSKFFPISYPVFRSRLRPAAGSTFRPSRSFQSQLQQETAVSWICTALRRLRSFSTRASGCAPLLTREIFKSGIFLRKHLVFAVLWGLV